MNARRQEGIRRWPGLQRQAFDARTPVVKNRNQRAFLDMRSRGPFKRMDDAQTRHRSGDREIHVVERQCALHIDGSLLPAAFEFPLVVLFVRPTSANAAMTEKRLRMP
jgi:hypothetical protein